MWEERAVVAVALFQGEKLTGRLDSLHLATEGEKGAGRGVGDTLSVSESKFTSVLALLLSVYVLREVTQE